MNAAESCQFLFLFSDMHSYTYSHIQVRLTMFMLLPMGRRNRRNSAGDQEKYVAGSKHHIGADEWTWVPFWRPMSLLKYYENVQLVGH